MAVVGIDLGTQFSKVAVAYCNTISMVPNDLFKLSTPTLVGYTEKQREFGDAAETSFLRMYDNTVAHVKRFLGRSYHNDHDHDHDHGHGDSALLEELNKWNYCQVNSSNDGRHQLMFEVTTSEGRQALTSEQVLGAYLRKLKELTTRHLEGAEIAHCVIACPIYFTDAQRRSLMAAATLAGWNVSHLLHEPTAVAISYAMSRTLEENRRVIFVDMGYSNTQVSVVDFGSSHLQMYAVSSDPFLGARDFDYALFDYFRNQFEKQHHIDLSQHPRARIRLMKGAERVKQLLTANKDAIHMLECLVNDIDFNLRITRQEFDTLCAPLLYKLSLCVQNAIDAMHARDAKTYTNGRHPPSIHSIEIVGGGTRIRSVQEQLVTVLKQCLPESQIDKCSTTLNGDECVARGATLMCAKESPVFRVRELQVQDINNWPIAMKYSTKTLGNPTSTDQQIVFPLYAACPDITKVVFDPKQSFKIGFEHPSEYEADGHALKYPIKCNMAIGEFQVSKAKIPQNGFLASQTQLVLTLNKHGLLEMPQAQLVETATADQEAELLNFDTGKEHTSRKIIQNLKVTGRFFSEITSQKLNEWMDLENRLATVDQIIKETNDQRNELETYVYDTRNKLEDTYKDLISESNKEKFLKYLDDVEQWLYDEGKNADKITYFNKLQELKKITDTIVNKPGKAKHKQPHNRPPVPPRSEVTNPETDEKHDEPLKRQRLKPAKPKSRQTSPAREKPVPPVRERETPSTREREDNYSEDDDNDFFPNDFFQRKRREAYLPDLADFFAGF